MIYYPRVCLFFSLCFSRTRCVRGKLADEPAENVIEGKRFIAASCGLKRASHKYSERGEFAKVANENFFLLRFLRAMKRARPLRETEEST